MCFEGNFPEFFTITTKYTKLKVAESFQETIYGKTHLMILL
jgi:hypothetical protein